jgi:phosphate-selective porin
MIDLNDGTVTGGVVRDLTAGVNWYANSTSKLQLNWIYSKVEDLGSANIWVLRYQFAIR